MEPPKDEHLSDAEKISRLRSALSLSLGALQGVRDAFGFSSDTLNRSIRKAKRTLKETG